VTANPNLCIGHFFGDIDSAVLKKLLPDTSSADLLSSSSLRLQTAREGFLHYRRKFFFEGKSGKE
jgi:hypothetical protein